MKMKHVLAAGFGALALGLVATSAQAGPVGGLVSAVPSSATDAGQVEKVHWYGHYRSHRYYGHYGHHYGHYHFKPYYYGHYDYYRPHYGWNKPYGWGHHHHYRPYY